MSPTRLVFRCSHRTICPVSYKIWFIGPTLYSPTLTQSKHSDRKTVSVKVSIQDPGKYLVYAWPEFEVSDVHELVENGRLSESLL